MHKIVALEIRSNSIVPEGHEDRVDQFFKEMGKKTSSNPSNTHAEYTQWRRRVGLLAGINDVPFPEIGADLGALKKIREGTYKEIRFLVLAAHKGDIPFIKAVLESIETLDSVTSRYFWRQERKIIAKYMPDLIISRYETRASKMEQCIFLTDNDYEGNILYQLARYHKEKAHCILARLPKEEKDYLLDTVVKRLRDSHTNEGIVDNLRNLLERAEKKDAYLSQRQEDIADFLIEMQLNEIDGKVLKKMLSNYGIDAEIKAILKTENKKSGSPIAMSLLQDKILIRFLKRFSKEDLAEVLEITDKDEKFLWEKICEGNTFIQDELFNLYEQGLETLALLQKKNKKGETLVEILRLDNMSLIEGIVKNFNHEEKTIFMGLKYEETTLISRLWVEEPYSMFAILKGLPFENKMDILKMDKDKENGIHRLVVEAELDSDNTLKEFVAALTETREERNLLLDYAEKDEWPFKDRLRDLVVEMNENEDKVFQTRKRQRTTE